MLSEFGSRLAVVAVLLTTEVVVFSLELLVLFTQEARLFSWYNLVRQLFGPALVAVLGAVLASISFSNSDNIAGTVPGTQTGQCPAGADGDIAGDGVRVALWAQVIVLMLLSMIGSFHREASGIKEVGAGLVLTHMSLAIAILVQMERGSLSSADAILGAMLLDAQNISMSIQLAAKEALAARWQVGIVLVTEVFGLAVSAELVRRFASGSFATDDCGCLTVFWWAWLSNCQESPLDEMPIYWTYYACRCVILIQTTVHSALNTEAFDKAEKDDKPPENVTYLFRLEKGDAKYSEYPTTLSLMYGFYGLLAITSLVTVEMTMKDRNISASSPVESVGQISALVIAGGTILRALWLIMQLFRKHSASKRFGFMWPFPVRLEDFQWPFSLETTSYLGLITWDSGYLMVPSLHYRSPMTYLGTLISDPHDPETRLGHGVPDPGRGSDDVPEVHNATFSSTARPNPFTVKLDSMRTVSFVPTFEMVTDAVDQSEVRRLGRRTLYMITGIKIASGLTLIRDNEHGVEAEVTEAGIPGASVELEAQRTSRIAASTRIEEDTDASEDILWAYRLHTIKLNRSGTVKAVGRVYTNGPLLSGGYTPMF
jgi:hypothetical protein